MNFILRIMILSGVSALVLSAPARADDRATITSFYDLLSNPSAPETMAKVTEILAEDWLSIGNYSGKNKTREMFAKQLGGFGKILPDLNWAIQEIVQDGDRYVVRSRATGTPIKPFFGVDGQGRGFDIMTIDMHTVKKGKIIRSYHVEDWANALRQLKGK